MPILKVLFFTRSIATTVHSDASPKNKYALLCAVNNALSTQRLFLFSPQGKGLMDTFWLLPGGDEPGPDPDFSSVEL